MCPKLASSTVPRVLQAHPGEFLEKFEFKDEEYLEFSKLTQVSS